MCTLLNRMCICIHMYIYIYFESLHVLASVKLEVRCCDAGSKTLSLLTHDSFMFKDNVQLKVEHMKRSP